MPFLKTLIVNRKLLIGKKNPYEQKTINCKPAFTLIELLVARHPKPSLSSVALREGWRRRKAAFGFTLIELLVVISIIGILAALASASYSDSQKKSRDSRRKSDLTAIQKALELAKQDSAGNYSYPICVTYGPPPAGTPANACYVTDSSVKQGGTTLAPTYIKKAPVDPKTSVGYTYTPSTASCATGACVSYTLYACLENSKDPQKDGTNSCISPLVSYTITNL